MKIFSITFMLCVLCLYVAHSSEYVGECNNSSEWYQTQTLSEKSISENDIKASLKYAKKSVEIAEKCFGAGSTEAAEALLAMSILLVDNKKYSHARGLLTKGIDIVGLSENDRNSLDFHRYLGFVLEKEADLFGAERKYREALVLSEAMFGRADELRTIPIKKRLAQVYRKLGDQEKMITIENELSTTQNLLSKEKDHHKAIRQKMDEGLLRDAIPLMHKQKDTVQVLYGKNSVYYSLQLEQIAETYCTLEDVKRSKEYYVLALQSWRITRGDDHVRTINVRDKIESLTCSKSKLN